MALLLGLAALLAAEAPDEARLALRFVRPDGTPAANVRVVVGEVGRATIVLNAPETMFVTTPGLSREEGARWSAELRTDREGRAEAPPLAPGEYTIVAGDALGMAIAARRLAPGAADVEIALEPTGFLDFELTGLDHERTLDVLLLEPPEGIANVSLSPRLDYRAGSWAFRTSPLPPIGGWRVHGTRTVLQNGYRGTLFDLPVDVPPGRRTEVRVDLAQGLALRGSVRGPEGEPLARVSVVARDASTPPRALGALTDERGEFRIVGLAPGRWTLDARRWLLRDQAGCGNGREDLHARAEVELPLAEGGRVDLRLAAFTARLEVGQPAPDFEVATLDGRPLRLSALRGKVVLLDFWATWCGMCRTELPALAAAHARHAAGGDLEVVGVSLDKDPDLVRRFVASRGLRWTQTALGRAPDNPIARLYNVNSTPSTVLVHRDGTIAALDLLGDPLYRRVAELASAR